MLPICPSHDYKAGNTQIKVTKNSYNSFWAPDGRFWNITEILINDQWYKCGLRFIETDSRFYIQFIQPHKVDEDTCMVTEMLCDGIYKEIEISKFKYNLLKYLENSHELNAISYKFRRAIFERRQTIIIFSIATIPSILFYYVNKQYENVIIHLLSENTAVQTLFFFLTISGFISIFQPFSIRKEITKKDIKEIIKKERDLEKRIEEIRRDVNC